MGINIKGIIYYKITESNVNSNIFGEFIDNLIEKLTDTQKDNSLIILDNAKVHKTNEIINKYKEKNLKILTNIPYKSNYNGIEYCFGHFKNEYYRFILKDKIEQKSKIVEILNSDAIKENIPSFLLQNLIFRK